MDILDKKSLGKQLWVVVRHDNTNVTNFHISRQKIYNFVLLPALSTVTYMKDIKHMILNIQHA